jgi:SpoIID/LytB domain protein
MRRTHALLTLLTVALGFMPPAPATAQPSPTRIRVEAPAGQSLLVHGEYPPTQSSCVDPYQPVLHARYRGAVEIVRSADGSLSLIGELPFEDYLKGIAEVPRDWPMEALKAQVVAARTYALNKLQAGSPSPDYDLCATTECQVYVGMEVEAGPWGDRWVRAVEDTAGQALVHDGVPAVTFYSSTSPGHTFDNEDVFGGEPLPYLRGVPERDDRASPVARWRVEMPLEDVARFLAVGGRWSGGPIRRVTASGGAIAFEGAGHASLSKDDLRDVLNEQASCRAPDRYPTTEPDGYQLPQTVPSDWYRAAQEGRNLVLVGRGWGHGVGMVQWGAFGKARRGLAYDDILAAYYGGLRPQVMEVPGTFRVLVAEGLRQITIVPPEGAAVDGAPAPPWTIAAGARLRLRHSPAPVPLLETSAFHPEPTATSGQPYRSAMVLSDDANVRLEFLQEQQVAGSTATVPLEEGRARVAPAIPELAPGRYEVRAVADNGVDVVSTGAVPVRVIAAAPSPAPPSPTTTRPAAAPPATEKGRSFPIVGGLAALGVVALLVLLASRGRKGLHRQP